MRTSNGEDLTRMLNPFALDCLKMYRQAESSEDVENFIVDVINGRDDLAQERQAFLEERLLPPNGRTASQNIFEDLLKSLS